MARKFRRCSALLLFVGAQTLLADDVHLHDPIDARVPQAVFDTWQSIDWRALKESEGGGPNLSFAAPPSVRTRVDLFVKKDGEWNWLLSRMYSPLRALPVVPKGQRVGVLVRSSDHPGYAWGETWIDDHAASQRVAMEWLRSLDVHLPAAGSVTLFLEGSPQPRSAANREQTAHFQFVPFSRAFTCFSNGLTSSCVDVPQNATEVRIALPLSQRFVSIFQTDRSLNATAKTSSLSALRAKSLVVTTIAVNGWLAATIDDPPPLNDFVVDLEGDQCAITRFVGGTLPPPPDYRIVAACEHAGVVVRTLLRGLNMTPEEQAEIGVFQEGSPIEARVPLAVARRGPDGDFHLPAIGSGRYRLKLFSAMSTGQVITATLDTSQATLVTFDVGPVVSGHVTLQAGGTTDKRAVIEVVRSANVPSADQIAKMGEDVADWMRLANAEEDGHFSVVITVPGPYHLRARWGSGIGTRDFTMPKPARDIDLGDIALSRAATLRGMVPDCENGVVRMTSLPDLSKPLQMTAALVDTRTATSDTTGRFFFEGLIAGDWFLSATCGGQPVQLQPQQLSLFPGQDMIIEARIKKSF